MDTKDTEKLTCYSCTNFFYDCFCGYKACRCKIYGNIDLGQCERHPDYTAQTCPDYKKTEGK